LFYYLCVCVCVFVCVCVCVYVCVCRTMLWRIKIPDLLANYTHIDYTWLAQAITAQTKRKHLFLFVCLFLVFFVVFSSRDHGHGGDL